MKPYFAKYLPVGGKIKDGDYAINSAGCVYQCLLGNAETQKDTKVKLFLCSRAESTREGQRFFHPNNPSNTMLLPEGGLPLHEPFIGIVGEISPEAIWVKEGDELNEEEIKRFTRLPPNQQARWIEENEKLGYPTVIKIRGQYGYFH